MYVPLNISHQAGIVFYVQWNLAGDNVQSSKTLSNSDERGEPLNTRYIYQKVHLSWERHLRLSGTLLEYVWHIKIS